MASKKLLVVFGATGNQGGSVISHILKDPRAAETFKLRGITRDVTKPSAKALESKGVEPVSADLDDKASIAKAVQGAYAVFGLTDYWNHLDAEREVRQGHNIVDACKEAGVQHLVFSVLIDVTKLTQGKFKHVYHFDSKAKIHEYIKQSGVPFTAFMPGFYMDNLASSFHQTPQGLKLVAPYSEKTPIPLFDAGGDTGLFVKAILMNREKTLGKHVLAATDYYTPTRIIDEFKRAKPESSKDLGFLQASEKDFKGALAANNMPEFVQEELWENMTFMEPYGYYGGEKLDWSHSLLDDKPTTFEDFVHSSPKFAKFN